MTTLGATVWVRDVNHRVYRKPESGRILSSGGPLERGYWVTHTIESETSRSWVLSSGRKIPKSGYSPPDVAMSKFELNEKIWVRANFHKVAEAVRALAWGNMNRPETFTQLVRVCEAIGYPVKLGVEDD